MLYLIAHSIDCRSERNSQVPNCNNEQNVTWKGEGIAVSCQGLQLLRFVITLCSLIQMNIIPLDTSGRWETTKHKKTLCNKNTNLNLMWSYVEHRYIQPNVLWGLFSSVCLPNCVGFFFLHRAQRIATSIFQKEKKTTKKKQQQPIPSCDYILPVLYDE